MTLAPHSFARCATCGRHTVHLREEVSASWILRAAAWLLIAPALLYGACVATETAPDFIGAACGLAVVGFFVALGFEQMAVADTGMLRCGTCGERPATETMLAARRSTAPSAPDHGGRPVDPAIEEMRP